MLNTTGLVYSKYAISVSSMLLEKVDNICPLCSSCIVENAVSLVVACVNISTALDELCRHLCLAVAVNSHDESCLSKVVPCVDVSSSCKKSLDDFRVLAAVSCKVE